MDSSSIEPTVGTPKNPVPLLKKRIELLEGEVQMLHKKLLAARRELALLSGGDPQQALEELLAELKRSEQLRLERERQLADAKAREAEEAKESEFSSAKRRGHGPRPQSRLPMFEKLHELEPEQCQCKLCGGQLEPMGEQFEEFEEITVYERKYAKVVHKRRKYRCRCNGNVETAPGPVRLIPGGRYSLDFAIQVAVDKYLDHLPLERQCRIMARQGLEASSQTLWDQLDVMARLAEPTYEEYDRRLFLARVMHADETRWPLLDGKKKSAWTIWTRSTPELVHYNILSSRSSKAAKRLFAGFDGVVVVDGYAVYEKLIKDERRSRSRDGPQMRLANCWAHALRKFSGIEENFPTQCRRILNWIGKLYEIEDQVPGPFPGDEAAQRLRLQLRQEMSKPILQEIRTWAETEVGLPRSALGKAIKYMLKRWTALTRFVDDPLIPLDNNAAERSLRGPVVGRKNHYGSKSKRGTEVAAIFYSLLETAKLCGVEPALYLKTVVERALLKPGAITMPEDLLPAPADPA